jgi:hypothetical protein
MLSLAINLEKPVMSLYGTEWREHGFRLGSESIADSIHPLGPIEGLKCFFQISSQ